jgi:hypothetical protein
MDRHCEVTQPHLASRLDLVATEKLTERIVRCSMFVAQIRLCSAAFHDVDKPGVRFFTASANR